MSTQGILGDFGCPFFLFVVAAFGPTMFWVDWGYIRCCGNGGWRFRPYGEALFSNAKKVPKKARPGVRPLAGARCSFVPAFIWGHRLRSASRRPPLDVFDFVERRYAPAPQMNASTQPAEGAGGSKSKAGELPLGLLSGEERSVYADLLWELACQRWRPESRPISHRYTKFNCGSELARDDGLPADQSLPATP